MRSIPHWLWVFATPQTIPHWLWVFATPQTTVYTILRGRGFDAAAMVLGTDFAGVLVRDGWVAYRGFDGAMHQSCAGHLLRRCKRLRESSRRRFSEACPEAVASMKSSMWRSCFRAYSTMARRWLLASCCGVETRR